MLYSHFQQVKDPISSYTHFIGAISSAVILIGWIIYGAYFHIEAPTLLSVIAFGIALIALYSASSYYHSLPLENPKQVRARKLDHSMIYVLIVGTYTPFIVKYAPNATTIVLVLWSLAILGIIMKIFWLQAPRWLYTSLYIILGWSIVFIPNIFHFIPLECLILVAIGGISYTIGAIIYIVKKPNINAEWTFHEIFHVLIMVGSLSHVLAVTFFVL
ncbi:MAG: hemolysin III family protein [Erysipelotrichaceae bacterium]|nr:hemolysin III family protein [Erysipelotrichaceae bacterium]